MKAISIINPKGGSGKSTLATNLAGYFAQRSPAVLLGDVDRQQSSRRRLQARHRGLPPVQTWQIGADQVARPPKGVTHAILDTPAGLSGKALRQVVKVSSRIIVPVQPSPFDLWATQQLLEEIRALRSVSQGKASVALVGMRVDPRTLGAVQLKAFLAQFGFRTLTMIRPTQLYGRVAAAGASIFDVSPSMALREREDWQPLLQWIDDDPAL
ncbi:MAG TPA: ParA family protein [Hydrogenophaga sp.]